MNRRSRFATQWRRWAPYMIGFVGGLAIFLSLTSLSPTPASRVAIAREVTPNAKRATTASPRLTCSGGMEAPAHVRLLPDAVIAVAGRETVEYHAEIDVNRGKSVGLAWEAEVIDDRGQRISSKLAPGTARAKAGDTNATGGILPQQLPDGFYMLRVRVAVSPDDAPATVMEAIQYVNVNGGKWREMDDAQWRADSNVRLAFRTTTPPSTKGGR